MSDIKRWRTEDDHYRPVEFVADDGPWVDYEDHAAAMQAKDAAIEQLQARIAELEAVKTKHMQQIKKMDEQIESMDQDIIDLREALSNYD